MNVSSVNSLNTAFPAPAHTNNRVVGAGAPAPVIPTPVTASAVSLESTPSTQSKPALPSTAGAINSSSQNVNRDGGHLGFSMQTGANSITGLRHVHTQASATALPASQPSDHAIGLERGAVITDQAATGASNSQSNTTATQGESEGQVITEDDGSQTEAKQSVGGGGESSHEEHAEGESGSTSQDHAQLVEAKVLEQLKDRDIEVRNHERAHASVGGTHAQSPSFDYQTGSDGRRYAVGGEVQIDVTPLKNDPVGTIAKMKQVYAAAMAPIDPSMADIRVASTALQYMNEAKQELTDSMFDKGPKLEDSELLIELDKYDEANDNYFAPSETGFNGTSGNSLNGDTSNESTSRVSVPTATLELAYGLDKEDTSRFALQV